MFMAIQTKANTVSSKVSPNALNIRIHQYVSGPGCTGDSRNSGSCSVHGENPLHMPPPSTLCLSQCRLLLLMAPGHHTHSHTLLSFRFSISCFGEDSLFTYSRGSLVTLSILQLGHVFIASVVGGGEGDCDDYTRDYE